MFKEYRLQRSKDRKRSLPDQLNFAFAEGDTLIMKDGARMVMFACQGPDLNSASIEELDAQRALANRACCVSMKALPIRWTSFAIPARPGPHERWPIRSAP